MIELGPTDSQQYVNFKIPQYVCVCGWEEGIFRHDLQLQVLAACLRPGEQNFFFALEVNSTCDPFQYKSSSTLFDDTQ